MTNFEHYNCRGHFGSTNSLFFLTFYIVKRDIIFIIRIIRIIFTQFQNILFHVIQKYWKKIEVIGRAETTPGPSVERILVTKDAISRATTFRFAEERVAFVKLAPGQRVAEEQRIISEMPVLFHANSAINFRFLRARRVFFFIFFSSCFLSPRSFSRLCAMQLRVEQFMECLWWLHRPSVSSSARKLERRYIDTIGKLYIYITSTVVSLLSRYLDGHYETGVILTCVSLCEKNIRDFRGRLSRSAFAILISWVPSNVVMYYWK